MTMFSNAVRMRHSIRDPKPFFLPPDDTDYVGSDHSWLDVETHNGVVVAVWFGCRMLPFRQIPVDINRAHSMLMTDLGDPEIIGVEVADD